MVWRNILPTGNVGTLLVFEFSDNHFSWKTRVFSGKRVFTKNTPTLTKNFLLGALEFYFEPTFFHYLNIIWFPSSYQVSYFFSLTNFVPEYVGSP